MFEEKSEAPVAVADGSPRWLGMAVGVLALVSLVALGIGWGASSRAKANEQALASQTQALRQNVEVLGQRLSQAEESAAQSQAELNVITDKLKLTQGELVAAKRQAKTIREESDKRLAAMQTDVNNQLATKASTEDVKNLNGDVSGVKTDLEATKQNLQMARGEMGTLIARNHDEIDQLRRLGERDYFEFTIDKRGTRQHVGDLTVELRGVSPKHNLFSVIIYADDTRYEKKNRSANEPIYFYTRGVNKPLELVVNQIGPNRITGYLSVPKVKTAQGASGN